MRGRDILLSGTLLLFTLATVSVAQAQTAIRLEKEVPRSAVVAGVTPIIVKIFPSKTGNVPAATEQITSGVMVSIHTPPSGGPVYRARMDFTNTGPLAIGTDFWWELWVGGIKLGQRERVPQSARALFAEQAVTAITLEGMNITEHTVSSAGNVFTILQLGPKSFCFLTTWIFDGSGTSMDQPRSCGLSLVAPGKWQFAANHVGAATFTCKAMCIE